MAGDRPVGALQIDLLSAVFLIVLSLLALGWLIPTQVSTDAGEYDLSPSFFPSVGVWIVLTLALLLLIVRSWQLAFSSRDSTGGSTDNNGVTGARAIAAECLSWSLAGAAFFYLLPMAGFLPTAIVVVLLGTRICGRRDWLPGLALGVVFCWLIQQGAWAVFTVALP